MINITVKFTPKIQGIIAKLNGDIRGGMKAGMIGLVAELEARAVKATPVVTSNLVNSITNYIANDGASATIKATAKYAAFVHDGTGLYGPLKRLIKPVNKKALFWPGAKHPVKSIKGQKPNPFFEKAEKQTNIQGAFEQGMNNYLKARGA